MFAKSQDKLQTFDWNKLPLLWTLTNEDTNWKSLIVSNKGSEFL